MEGPRISLQRVKLFNNERLESLTLVSPLAFVVTWTLALPMIAWIGWGKATLPIALSLFVGGLFLWTLFEYAMHRCLFHWKLEWAPVKWLVFVMHGNHHETPNDRMRNLMPPVVSLPIAALVWASCVALAGAAGTWLFLGYIVGYVGYDVTHFACHQWPMRGRLGQALKQHHMRHHYVDEERNYAITAILWDRVFGSGIGSRRR